MTDKPARRFRWLQRHPVALHVFACFARLVPITHGRLGRFTGMLPSP